VGPSPDYSEVGPRIPGEFQLFLVFFLMWSKIGEAILYKFCFQIMHNKPEASYAQLGADTQ